MGQSGADDHAQCREACAVSENLNRMDSSNLLVRQGRHLLQIGVILLLFSSFEGFAIPHVAAPRLGLSVHTLSALQAVLLLALGLLWPKLSLGLIPSRLAFGFLVYSAFAILAAYVMAALWGAGNETMPLAAGPFRGSDLQEAIIKLLAYSSAPTGLASFGLILWGLSNQPPKVA